MRLRDVPRTSLLGREVEVVAATNPSLVGIKGTIAKETKHSFVVAGKSVLKSAVTIRIIIDGKAVVVAGKILQRRPEDRIKIR